MTTSEGPGTLYPPQMLVEGEQPPVSTAVDPACRPSRQSGPLVPLSLALEASG